MRIAGKMLLAGLVLAELLGQAAPAGQTPWYYHVNAGGADGTPVQSEADPGLSSCWNSINAAFAAVRSQITPGPWIIQVDDDGVYDEAVVLSDLQTSATETLTLTKAPWLAGRPTVYPRQLARRALAINAVLPRVSESLSAQADQADRRVTFVTIRGFIFKNNASGTNNATEEPVFSDNQGYLREGVHIIEDCIFDGENQVYDSRSPILVSGTCLDTVFRRNIIRDFILNDTNKVSQWGRGHGSVLVVAEPVTNVVRQARITVADNLFCGNQGFVAIFVGDAARKRQYELVFERNRLIKNVSVRYPIMMIERNGLSNIVRNNLLADNSASISTLWITTSGNTQVYHNTFFNNHSPTELLATGDPTMSVDVKNNLFWPTAGNYCITVRGPREDKFICANNAFYTDFRKDGYPPGFGLSQRENTEAVGWWKEDPITTYMWNQVSTNFADNGYTLGGPGLDRTRHLFAASPCIDRGIPGLVADDLDGRARPVGAGYDIGAFEYGTVQATSPVGPDYVANLESQRLAPEASIHWAAGIGDLAKLEAFIKTGIDINQLDTGGYAPSHHAAQNDQCPAMAMLIAEGADVNVKSSRGQSPLDYAILAGNNAVAELLLAKGAAVNPKNENGQVPPNVSRSQPHKGLVEFSISEASVHTAASLGDIVKVKNCLGKGVDPNLKDTHGQTALHKAVRFQQKEMAALLISKGADVNARDEKGYTPLYYALWKEVEDTVKLLVAGGADVSYTAKDDYPPLHYAVWNKDVHAVRLLVDHGADFDVKDLDGSTAFREAASQGSKDLLEVFVAKGGNFSPLLAAAGMGDLARVKALVSQGADISFRDKAGRTALHYAAATAQAETSEFLIVRGADVQAKTEDAVTPMHLAALVGGVKVVGSLLSRGAGIDPKDKDGSTPLHHATAAGQKAVVELLLARGADASLQDNKGRTALKLAEQRRGRNEIAEILRKHEAKP